APTPWTSSSCGTGSTRPAGTGAPPPPPAPKGRPDHPPKKTGGPPNLNPPPPPKTPPTPPHRTREAPGLPPLCLRFHFRRFRLGPLHRKELLCAGHPPFSPSHSRFS